MPTGPHTADQPHLLKPRIKWLLGLALGSGAGVLLGFWLA